MKIQRITTYEQKYQVFNDFPLFDTKPINWNAMINSRYFYPKLNRSDVDVDVNENWKILEECFTAVK